MADGQDREQMYLNKYIQVSTTTPADSIIRLSEIPGDGATKQMLIPPSLLNDQRGGLGIKIIVGGPDNPDVDYGKFEVVDYGNFRNVVGEPIKALTYQEKTKRLRNAIQDVTYGLSNAETLYDITEWDGKVAQKGIDKLAEEMVGGGHYTRKVMKEGRTEEYLAVRKEYAEYRIKVVEKKMEILKKAGSAVELNSFADRLTKELAKQAKDLQQLTKNIKELPDTIAKLTQEIDNLEAKLTETGARPGGRDSASGEEGSSEGVEDST
ncbi:hypothetical protein CDD80_1665 [Ophiocordyceps camponoti-rufipedis]|uniref:Uncharacterized protein n=1 Tax=Ophiocordyceps camponoti-rufipedis TaxID=2004952 RepID=A0A2C5ZA45_9HYPO|nr:hypothetical protein CDD80_1665 [Ophiocordyceps camponoti-rufipedis]